ncbi:MAG: hypothetical protein H6621_13020 [Halobacteriovoraceae bacterium]|nr:hypothetical protein [Halobacteriovoraceae bacterium]
MTQYILIDDDPLIHKIWKFSAKKNGIDLKTYFCSKDFYYEIENLDQDSHVCIDYNLGFDKCGIELAFEIYNKGFKSVFISTGFEKKSIAISPHTFTIINKQPPWEIKKHALMRTKKN